MAGVTIKAHVQRGIIIRDLSVTRALRGCCQRFHESKALAMYDQITWLDLAVLGGSLSHVIV